MAVDKLSNHVRWTRTGDGDLLSLVASRNCYIFTCKMSHAA